MSKLANHLYEFGPFRLDATQRLLLREGVPVPLSFKVFDTLLVLVQYSGRLLDRDELMKTLWPDTIVEENNLSQNISILRKVLGESAEQKYIETIPKRGFRFVAPVQEVSDEVSTVIVRERSRAALEAVEVEDRGSRIEDRNNRPSSIVAAPPHRKLNWAARRTRIDFGSWILD